MCARVMIQRRFCVHGAAVRLYSSKLTPLASPPTAFSGSFQLQRLLDALLHPGQACANKAAILL